MNLSKRHIFYHGVNGSWCKWFDISLNDLENYLCIENNNIGEKLQ